MSGLFWSAMVVAVLAHGCLMLSTDEASGNFREDFQRDYRAQENSNE